MYKRCQIGLITSILLLYGCSQGEEEFAGRVIRILDGDTIEVLHNRSPERIRLAEIDAPEKSQPFGTRARQFAAELAFNQTVTVRPHDRDRYGRTVAEIILSDERSLNRELVRNGFAWHYRRYSSDQTLEALEQEARDNRRGLWRDPHPVPPWEYASFFTDPERGMVEVGCWAHARRHFHNALENDQARMGGVLAMIAHLYEVEKVARQSGLSSEDLRLAREHGARPMLDRLHEYLRTIREQVLPKSEAGRRLPTR